MFTVAKPRVPVTACRVGPSQGRNGASTSPSDPNPSQSHERLTQSANRNKVERQQRGTTTTNNNKSKKRRYEGKDKNHLTSVTCS